MRALIAALEFDKKDKESYVILVSAPLLLSLYWYFGSADAFGRFFPGLATTPDFEYYSRIYQFISFFLLLFVVPLIYLKFGIRKQLSDYGFGLGDRAYGVRFCLIAVPFLILPLISLAATMPDVRAEYPLAKLLFSRRDLVLSYEVTYVALYYLAWEFYFRGFVLFGLKDKFGSMNAVLIQTISSALIHLGKPDVEMFGSILSGIIFGALALRTRSFWYVFLLHATIGVLTDLYILYM